MSDCLIIGAGIIGMTTALALHKHGLRVTLLDKGQVGMESSWAGGGILSPLHPWRYPAAVSTLVADSLQRYPVFIQELESNTGLQTEFLSSGALFIDNDAIQAGQAWAQQHQKNCEYLHGSALITCEPALARSQHRALLFPEIHQIRTPRLLKTLHTHLQSHNIRIEEQQTVQQILHADGHITGLKTQNKTWHTEYIIITAGAWSGELLKQNALQTPKITPVKGQMILLKTRPSLLRHIILDAEGYLIPRTDGCILAGSTLEHTGFNKDTTLQARNQLHQLAQTRVPALQDAPITHHWAGLRPESEHGIPSISAHPQLKGLFINTGHFRNGLAMAPGSAALLSALLTQQQPAIEPAPYQL